MKGMDVVNHPENTTDAMTGSPVFLRQAESNTKKRISAAATSELLRA